MQVDNEKVALSEPHYRFLMACNPMVRVACSEPLSPLRRLRLDSLGTLFVETLQSLSVSFVGRPPTVRELCCELPCFVQANEKLAEGIRKFAVDIVKLENLLKEML